MTSHHLVEALVFMRNKPKASKVGTPLESKAITSRNVRSFTADGKYGPLKHEDWLGCDYKEIGNALLDLTEKYLGTKNEDRQFELFNAVVVKQLPDIKYR